MKDSQTTIVSWKFADSLRPSVTTGTPATVYLEIRSLPFVRHAVSKDDMRAGESVTQSFARQVGLPDDSCMVKTMVFDIDKAVSQDPIFVLQHGNKKVDTKRLATAVGVKRDHVKPTKPERATAFTGYVFGGTTAFGSKSPLKIFVESTIFSLPTVYVNGGSTGLCLSMNIRDFENALGRLAAQRPAKMMCNACVYYAAARRVRIKSFGGLHNQGP